MQLARRVLGEEPLSHSHSHSHIRTYIHKTAAATLKPDWKDLTRYSMILWLLWIRNQPILPKTSHWTSIKEICPGLNRKTFYSTCLSIARSKYNLPHTEMKPSLNTPELHTRLHTHSHTHFCSSELFCHYNEIFVSILFTCHRNFSNFYLILWVLKLKIIIIKKMKRKLRQFYGSMTNSWKVLAKFLGNVGFIWFWKMLCHLKKKKEKKFKSKNVMWRNHQVKSNNIISLELEYSRFECSQQCLYAPQKILKWKLQIYSILYCDIPFSSH